MFISLSVDEGDTNVLAVLSALDDEVINIVIDDVIDDVIVIDIADDCDTVGNGKSNMAIIKHAN